MEECIHRIELPAAMRQGWSSSFVYMADKHLAVVWNRLAPLGRLGVPVIERDAEPFVTPL